MFARPRHSFEFLLYLSVLTGSLSPRHSFDYFLGSFPFYYSGWQTLQYLALPSIILKSLHVADVAVR